MFRVVFKVPIKKQTDTDFMTQSALLGLTFGARPVSKKRLAYLLATFLGILCLFIGTATYADDEIITPSHVFQLTQKSINELVPILKHKAARVVTVDRSISDRQPRHAWQKAREVLVKVNALLSQEGLPGHKLPPLYTKDVQPKDVYALVQKVWFRAQSVREKKGLLQKAGDVPFRGGKKPADVFNNLALLSAMLDSLLNSSIRPSNVVQMVQSTIRVLEHIYAHEGLLIPQVSDTDISGKSPRDVYILALSVVDEARKLAERPRYQIPGGVPDLKMKGGRITPMDVLSVSQILLADMQAISVQIGMADSIDLAPLESGKTPSDAYQQFLVAQALIRGLL